MSRTGHDERHRVCFVNDVPPYLPCSNPECRAKGYHIAAIITNLVKDRRTFYAREWVCDGCRNTFCFTLRLTYLEDSADLSALEETGS